jgi:hypothetical protein
MNDFFTQNAAWHEKIGLITPCFAAYELTPQLYASEVTVWWEN